MRVLMLHNRYKLKGGEDESAAAEAILLQNSGHEVKYLELDNDTIPSAGNLKTALGATWSQSAYRKVDSILATDKFDILHVQNFFPLWSPSVYYAASRNRTAVVQSIRNYRLLCPAATLFRDGHHCVSCVGKPIPWPGVVFGCYQNSRLRTSAVATMIAAHWALGTWDHSVHQYIALTNYVRGQLIAGHFPADRISVKPNFLVDPQITEAHEGSTNYFIYVGRLSREKGIDWLFSAWKLRKENATLKMVGGGRVPAGIDLPSGVEIMGERSLQETYRLIKRARALVLPAEWPEPFGRVVIEAFALGTPVISSFAGALPELIEHDSTGLLIENGNAVALAGAMDRLSTDPSLCAKLAKNGRLAYLKSYSDHSNYEQLTAIYYRAIEISELVRGTRQM